MIHKYNLNGVNIVLDVNSGAIHILDDLCYKLLDYFCENMPDYLPQEVLQNLTNEYTVDQIKDAFAELKELYDKEMLFSKDEIYNAYLKETNTVPVKALCLNIAHDCNLRCEYCFAAKGNFGLKRELMPLEVAKRAIDFLVEKSANRKNLEVDFFGGEPLMNFEVIQKIVAYARTLEEKHNKNFRFTLTTNGMLLTPEKFDFLNKEIVNVVLSLDGLKSTNDKVRLTPNIKGCYDIIVPNYLKFLESRGKKDYYVRGTFTKYNLNFSKDILHLSNLGFDQISMEPVSCDESLEYALTSQDLPKIAQEYEILAKEILKRKGKENEFNFFHFMIDLNQGPCAIKRLRGCGCGSEYLAVTPNGDIYPCHQFVGIDKWKMGNLFKNNFDTKIQEYFNQANIFKKEDCKDCWAKFYCSGGCNANNFLYQNDILKSHKIACDMEKKRIECAIMIKALQNLKYIKPANPLG